MSGPRLIFFILVAVRVFWACWNLEGNQPVFSSKSAHYRFVIQDVPVHHEARTVVAASLLQRVSPAPQKISGKIRITIPSFCDWKVGEVLVAKLALKRPVRFQVPGVFDSRRSLFRKGFVATAFLNQCEEAMRVGFKKMSVWKKFRGRVISKIENKNFIHGDLILALTFGQDVLSESHQKILRQNGLVHLFVISGMQFALVAVFVWQAAGFVFRFQPKIFLWLPLPVLLSFMTLVAATFYLKILSFDPSILRAWFFLGVLALTKACGLRMEIKKNFLTALGLHLLTAPLDIESPGFHLSYGAVWVLIFFCEEIFFVKNIYSRWRYFNFFLKLFYTGILIQLILLPYLIYLYPKWNIASLWQSLWASPFIDFLVMPFLWLGLLGEGIGFTGAIEFFSLADQCLGLFFWIIAKIPTPPDFVFSFAPHFFHLIFYGFLIVLFSFQNHKKIKIVFLLFFLASLMLHYFDLKHFSGARFFQIDVGQGDAEFLQTAQKNILVDTGGHIYRNIGEQVLLPFFRQKAVSHLDIVILTHPDFDHYGGLSGILDFISVGEVWVSSLSGPKTYQNLLRELNERAIPVRWITKETAYFLNMQHKIRILPATAEFTKKNDRSLLILGKAATFDYLLMGDAGVHREIHFLKLKNYPESIDWIKIGHHGSRTSTHPALIKILKPNLATIAVGENSPFGHPHSEVIRRLKENFVKTSRTDQEGTIRISVIQNRVSLCFEAAWTWEDFVKCWH